MIIAGKFSFNDGEKIIEEKYKNLFDEIKEIISSINAEEHKTKESKEKTMHGKLLYNPVSLNKAFKLKFEEYGWEKRKIKCQYSAEFYVEEFKDFYMQKLKNEEKRNPYREMDFVKDKLGVEVQFGKYAFMAYNVCAKMTIFHKLGLIDAGVEIVPVKMLAEEMSTGVSYFEQIVWDLEKRGIANIDIPVLILGIDTEARISEKTLLFENLK